MSREKQIEEMAREMCHLSAECKTCQICNERYNGDDDDDLCYFKCVAKEIINHGYRKQGWISVDERLPDGFGFFLVAAKAKLLWETEWEYNVDIARYNVSKIPSVNGWDYETADGYEHMVTHWMPLPEAPKGGAE